MTLAGSEQAAARASGEKGEKDEAKPSKDEDSMREQNADAEPAPDKDNDTDTDTDTIPDGGLTAWLQVLSAWVVMVATWGMVNTFGVYQTYYETELLAGQAGGSSSAIAWIGSLQASLLLLAGVVAGPLYDAGHVRPLLRTGLLLVVLGQFMTSLCGAYWQLVLAQGLAMGLGMGLSFLPATAVLAQYFARRRALALGLANAGSPLAGVVFPIVFSRLQPRLGAAWASRVLAFVLLGLCVVPVVFMRPRVVARVVARGAGRVGPDAGPDPDTTPDTTPDARPRRHRRPLIDTAALRELPFVAVAVGGLCAFLCLYVPFFYLQLFAERRGIFNAAVSPFYLVTLLNTGSVFGRVVPNALADRFGSGNLMVVCSVASTALLGAWLGIAADSAGTLAPGTAAAATGRHYLGGTVAFALLYGLFSGGIVSLLPSIIFVLTRDLRRIGTRMGMVFSLTGIAILVGPPIAGAILGDGAAAARWMHTIGFALAGVAASAVCFAVSRGAVFRQRGGLVG